MIVVQQGETKRGADGSIEDERIMGSDPVFCLQPVRRMLKYTNG